MARGDADRLAYEERAREIRERIADGESIGDIMRSHQADRLTRLREMTDREERESLEDC